MTAGTEALITEQLDGVDPAELTGGPQAAPISIGADDPADGATAGTTVVPGEGAHTHIGARTIPARDAKIFLHPEGSADPAAHPALTGREEVWRFTPLRRLRGVHEHAPLTGTAIEVDLQVPDGVQAEHRDGSAGEALKGVSGYLPIDRPSLRAWQASPGVLLVDIPADHSGADPVVVTVTGTGGDEAVATHLIVRAGRFARAAVVVVYTGDATLVENVEIIADDGAALTVAFVDEWTGAATHLSSHHLRVGRDAKITHGVLQFGGDLLRATVSVDYTAPGGDVDLLGLYFADAGQHLEQRLFVDHDAPHCRSRVLYKGALQGAQAHTVWVGDVLIRVPAEGTDTYEMNRNLLLTDGARADSVPNLEIETGEIAGAGHASSTGRFDDDQLFYLQSRGIPEAVARRLVVRGFFAEVLTRIGIGLVSERADRTIESELALTGN